MYIESKLKIDCRESNNFKIMQKDNDIYLNEESDVITRDISSKVIGRLSQKSQYLIYYNELLDGISDPYSQHSTWLNVKTLPSDETNK